MTAAEFRDWRRRVGLTQAETAAKLGVTRGTIQNWESEGTAIPSMVETSCGIWEDRLRQIRPDIGPVTLIYSDGPMFINPYGPRRPLAMLKQEPYETNAAAVARARALWGRDDFHNPFILEESRKDLWNTVQLERAIKGEDPDAPLWRRVVIRRSSREEGVADASVKGLMNACARAYRAKGVPRDVVIYRDQSTADDHVFFFSPAAFALTSEIRQIADFVAFCDEPGEGAKIRKIDL